MKIFISSDHAGFALKEHLVSYLEENGLSVIDKGPFEQVPNDDYPDWISLTAEEIAHDPHNVKGIVIGYSGQGEAIVANKFNDIRAGVYYGGSEETIQLMREHNDINILSLGAHFITEKEAERAADIFIETQFSHDERHVRRIKKIKNIEVKN